MKLYICDHLGSHKTTANMEKWFKAKGHEVMWDQYYDENIMAWSDVAFFAWTEGMLHRALRESLPETPEVKQDWRKKTVITQAMDIEVWSGQPNGTEWDKLDGVTYCSKFIGDLLIERQELKTKHPNLPLYHIPLSIDMDEMKFQERKPGNKIAVIGHMWNAKGAELIPQFMRRLIDVTKNDKWEIHVQGHWRHDVWEWYFYYFNHIVKELGLEKNIFINEERVDSIDEWLSDKNYLVSFSMKDAFSLIIGEALAKGIKAFPHNFPGAKDIWGKYVWSDIDELVERIRTEDYNSQEYRDFVGDNYSNERIMPLWEKILVPKS